MKNVVISADGDRKVYSVPDVVADNLREYCIEFCDKWLQSSPQAKKYRKGALTKSFYESMERLGRESADLFWIHMPNNLVLNLQEAIPLIKDGKIKKEKPLPPITTDEIPYELPIGWSVARLNEIVNFENGDRSSNYPTEDEYVASGIPFWGAKDIINNKLQVNPGLRFINKSKFDELRSGKLKDKDFICLLRGSVGKWAEFTIDNEWTTGFINAQMVIIRLLDLVLSNWFKIYLNSPLFIEQVSKVTTGSAVAQMSAKDLSNFIILIPPLAEQQRIVTKVEELMQIVDELE